MATPSSKTPTRHELEKLAVEALGEGAKVITYTLRKHQNVAAAEYRPAMAPMVRVECETGDGAYIALAAALRALAEVRK